LKSASATILSFPIRSPSMCQHTPASLPHMHFCGISLSPPLATKELNIPANSWIIACPTGCEAPVTTHTKPYCTYQYLLRFPLLPHSRPTHQLPISTIGTEMLSLHLDIRHRKREIGPQLNQSIEIKHLESKKQKRQEKEQKRFAVHYLHIETGIRSG